MAGNEVEAEVQVEGMMTDIREITEGVKEVDAILVNAHHQNDTRRTSIVMIVGMMTVTIQSHTLHHHLDRQMVTIGSITQKRDTARIRRRSTKRRRIKNMVQRKKRSTAVAVVVHHRHLHLQQWLHPRGLMS